METIINGFFVLEGLDGSGTTTQLELLSEYFKKNDIPYFGTFEPTKSPIGKQIRRILQGETSVNNETIARLFSADRSFHLYEKNQGIIDQCAQGNIAICDRYLFSSLAYQAIDLDYSFVKNLNNFPLPEKVFFIDTPISECSKRRKNRENREIFEFEDIQKQVDTNYRKIFNDFENSAMKIIEIDGTLEKEKILEKICNELGI